MPSPILVQKYGGTSVGSPERIRAVAARIAASRKAGNRVVVVVSAMGRATDELIALAHSVSKDPHPREMDMLLTAGERISMALVSMALADLGVSAVSFTGSQTGIITDQSHRRARIRRILGDRVRATLAEDRVAIVAGFQGVSEAKEITTLGRGGSDTTAVALAAALQADLCEIYTDVDGVYSADPRVVPGARLYREIPADLMLELAIRGAGVLHPRSVEMARQSGVRVSVRSSLNSTEGTLMVQSVDPKRGLEEFGVAGVTADADQCLLEAEFASADALAKSLSQAAQAHLQLLAPVVTAQGWKGFVEVDAKGEWEKLLKPSAARFAFHDQIVPLSVVGHRFSQDCGALSEVLDVLVRSNISVNMASVAALAMTLGIPSAQADAGVKALHEHFFGGS
jgi:aspartate kinase